MASGLNDLATIDGDGGTDDVAPMLAGEPADHAGHLLAAEASDRVEGAHGVLELLGKQRHHGRFGYAGVDGVDADALGGGFDGSRIAQVGAQHGVHPHAGSSCCPRC